MKTRLTVRQAIRKHCLDCVGTAKEVKECIEVLSCNLWPYRLGKGRASVKLIRKYCLWCMGGSSSLIEKCRGNCTLWNYRKGKTGRKLTTEHKAKLVSRLKSWNTPSGT